MAYEDWMRQQRYSDPLTGIQEGGKDYIPPPTGPIDWSTIGDDPGYAVIQGDNGFDIGNLGQSGGGEGNWWDNFKLSDIMNMFPGVGSGDMSSALMIPAFAAAYKQWQDSGKYMDTAREAMQYGDPFGQANRSKYQQMLSDSYTNPDAVLQDPGHQAVINNGMGAISRTNAAKGYLGSGNMMADLGKYVTDENNTFLSDYRKNLMPLTGYQFDPSQAGKFLMQGQQQAIDSQNAALGDMFLPFLNKAATNNINNQSTGGQGGGTTKPGGERDLGPLNNRGVGTPNPIDWSKYNSTPQQIQSEIDQIVKVAGGMGMSAYDLFNKVLNGNYHVSESTRMFMEDVMGGKLDGSVPLGDGKIGSITATDLFGSKGFGYDLSNQPTIPEDNFGDVRGHVSVGDVIDVTDDPGMPDLSELPEVDYGVMDRIPIDDDFFDFTGGE